MSEQTIAARFAAFAAPASTFAQCLQTLAYLARVAGVSCELRFEDAWTDAGLRYRVAYMDAGGSRERRFTLRRDRDGLWRVQATGEVVASDLRQFAAFRRAIYLAEKNF